MTDEQTKRMNELADEDQKLLVPQDSPQKMNQREFCRGYTAGHQDASAEKDKEIAELKAELARITCGYCGALFERDWNELQEHIKVCEKHPVSKLQSELTALKESAKGLDEENKYLKEVIKELEK